MNDRQAKSQQQKHAIVVGAGIAGLTTALALAATGFKITICEQAVSLVETGAGLQLSPNATRLLQRLGVLEQLLPKATAVTAINLISAKSGTTLLSLNTSTLPGADNAPFLAVHRADLQAALLGKVLDDLNIHVLTGVTFVSALDAGSTVKAMFVQGQTDVGLECNLLIGADGVWSGVREFVPGHAVTRHSGYTALRATTPVTDALPDALVSLCRGKMVGAFLARDAHLVAYPLRGGTLINLVLITSGRDAVKSWDNPVDMTAPASTFGFAEPSMAKFLGTVEGWRSWPLHICPTDGTWTDGRKVLVGDAAHAMLPFAAQGACMAIEDGFELAQCLAGSEDVAAALANYEAKRRPRVAKVAGRGEFNRFAYHAYGPVALARNAVFALQGQRLMTSLGWLYGYEV